jgi:Recombination endonuclease VII
MAHGQEGSSVTELTAQEWIKREQGLRFHYGLTLAEYEEMSAKQSGVCAICGEPPNWGTLQVDHNHARDRPTSRIVVRPLQHSSRTVRK